MCRLSILTVKLMISEPIPNQLFSAARDQIRSLEDTQTAVPIMIELLQKSFPKNFKGWQSKLKDMMPGYGVKLNDNPELAAELEAGTARSLQLDSAPALRS